MSINSPTRVQIPGALTERVVHCSQPESNAHYPSNELRTTKYTPFTFLPKNLLEQFSRHINRYFLGIAVLQLWALITPVSPVTTWAPLIFVFAVSAAKEASDDIGRGQQDKVSNEKLYKVVRNGVLQQVKSRDIRVGDVVKLADGEQVPCDLCILASSSPDGSCTLQTMNLDGETNLKNRVSVPSIQCLSLPEVENFRGVIYCSPPDASVYRFDSRIDNTSLSGDQFIQQTTTVRNTEFVYGVAVYTGPETKFALNRGIVHVKWAKMDAFVNQIAIALFAFQLGLVVLFGVIGNVWELTVGQKHHYLGYSIDDGIPSGLRWMIIPLRFLLLNSTIIPISLKVTLDICKLYYAKFICWDRRFFQDSHESLSANRAEPLPPARANNTSISEDLGQIQCILTDKTGTLTENEMVFRKCSIKGALYSERDCGRGGRLFLAGEHNENSVTLDFLRNLALNSSVVPTKTANGSIGYKSSSPDEESLVDAAAHLGVQVVSRQGPVIELNVHGHTEYHIIRQELGFTSERRRMSVVVQDRATGNLTLYMKGGDDVVMERVTNQTQDDRVTISHLNSFASEGLRTLAFARKTLDPVQYAAWIDRFNAANSAIHNREELLSKVYEELEQDLELSGASAIEDRLQQGVPETIKTLRAAGIKIWMLTGDKFSTALQIATTCNLKSSLPESSILLDINGVSESSVSSELNAHLQSLQSQRSIRDVSLILRGASLTAAMTNSNKSRFLELCMSANAVICCRFSPKQKAQVVRMVKDAGEMTLAIGDGGNDVSMIMEAHVGVGIRGREGLQAARASDYQVNHFRSLLPLLLVHGRQSYLRSSIVSQYSYYKSFEFCMVQILFQFVNGFSGTALFNSASIAAYNVLLFVPILTFIFDQDISGDEAMRIPESYFRSQKGANFNWKTFGFWTLRATYQSLIIYGVCLLVYNWEFVHVSHGNSSDLETLGLLAFFSYMLVQSITLLLEMQYITIYNVVGVIGFHIFGMLLFFGLSNSMKFDSLIGYGSVQFVFSDPVFWVASLLVAALAVLPVLAVQYIVQQCFPDPLYEIRKQLLHPFTESRNQSTDVQP